MIRLVFKHSSVTLNPIIRFQRDSESFKLSRVICLCKELFGI